MVMAVPPAVAASVNKSTMVRPAHPCEIRLLPQIENMFSAKYS
jgi:hypothetical protein